MLCGADEARERHRSSKRGAAEAAAATVRDNNKAMAEAADRASAAARVSAAAAAAAAADADKHAPTREEVAAASPAPLCRQSCTPSGTLCLVDDSRDQALFAECWTLLLPLLTAKKCTLPPRLGLVESLQDTRSSLLDSL